jgi:hypothetical protein
LERRNGEGKNHEWTQINTDREMRDRNEGIFNHRRHKNHKNAEGKSVLELSAYSSFCAFGLPGHCFASVAGV